MFEDTDDKAPWVPDNASNYCTRCRKGFSLFNRRHHCRACGFLFCKLCSVQTDTDVPGYLPPHLPQRVCEDCKKDPPRIRRAREAEERRKKAAAEALQKAQEAERFRREEEARQKAAEEERLRQQALEEERQARRLAALREAEAQQLRREQARREEEERKTKEEESAGDIWKNEVLKATKFKPHGPEDRNDHAMWRSLDGAKGAGDVPSLCALQATATRSGFMHKLGQKQNMFGGGGWSRRFFMLSGRFLYYFKQNVPTEKPLGAVYIYGATFDEMTDLVEGRGLHQPFHVEVKTLNWMQPLTFFTFRWNL
eukprot:PhF_6_TR27343/c1_g1_i4/m.40182